LRVRRKTLIVLLTRLLLRGEASDSRAAVSGHYPLIEAANGVLWVLVVLFMEGPPYVLALGCLMASALLIIGAVDAQTMEIPLPLNGFILVLGLLRLALDYENWLSHALGFAAVSGFLLLLFVLSGGRAIGGGDIKLMAACGLFLGWQLILIAFVTGCAFGSAIHLTRMALKNAGRTLAFGPYLAAGVFCSMLWGNAFL
jgi:leader peptidase (prepilin peptidase)/N-methyltransferase